MEILSIENVSLKKEDKNGIKKEILNGISFSLSEGKSVSILGPSGSGKSSILKLLNRLDDPDSGNILFNGKKHNTYDVTELRKRIALIWQTPIVFKETVRDEICFALKISKRDYKLDDNELLDFGRKFGFDESFLEKNPQEMSVGEKQRLSLIRALILKPDVLLLDEPTSALDIHSKAKVSALIKTALNNSLKGIIMVTHDIELASEFCCKGIILEKGQIKHEGDIKEILTIWQTQYK